MLTSAWQVILWLNEKVSVVFVKIVKNPTTNVVTFLFQITKRQVDTFVPGRRVPSCQLCVEWAGQQKEPLKLAHRVELLGAKEPFNFFLIRPPSLTPPSQPPTPLHPKSMCLCSG